MITKNEYHGEKKMSCGKSKEGKEGWSKNDTIYFKW